MRDVPFTYGVDVLDGTSKKPIPASRLASWVQLTRQHVTRLCRSKAIPGAFQTKGGHWRVRPSKALADWIVRYVPAAAHEPMPDSPMGKLGEESTEANLHALSYGTELAQAHFHFKQLERAFRRKALQAKARSRAYHEKIRPTLFPIPAR